MQIKRNVFLIILPFLIFTLTGCADKIVKKSKPFKHDTPLIKTDVKKLGKVELEKIF